MVIAIAPVYAKLVHRFISNVGPHSLAKISEDTGISTEELDQFEATKELDPVKIMTLWSTIFGSATFLQAASQMDAFKFDRPE
jgi:hypothetical protein